MFTVQVTNQSFHMKIIILVDNLGSGGMQAQLVNLMNGFLRNGHQIHLVLYHSNEDKGFFSDALDLPHENIIQLKSSGGFKFSVPKYIYSESHHYDVILSFLHSANFYVTCSKIFNLFSRKNLRFRNIVVDMSSFGNRRNWRLSMMSFFSMLFSNKVISNSDTQNSYYRNLPGGNHKSVFIPNGVDKDRFFIPCKQWEKEDRDFLLVIGRVSRAKNGPSFVKAIRELSLENGQVSKVVWVGRFDNDAMALEDKSQMDNQISELVSQGLLEWKWEGEVENVEWYYSHASCLVIPSRWEGVPNVLVEAMLAGCPVVSTPVSDIPNILGNSERGILCEGIEADQIADGIRMFGKLNSYEIDKMRLRAQSYAVKEFSVNNMVNKYKQVISEVCS